ncbi:MAG: ABC transporter ATP-binding protein [Proteobacteria bacterium]|nr:ABC transporter ATP-binding protein [Pseudomonadota bacterium]
MGHAIEIERLGKTYGAQTSISDMLRGRQRPVVHALQDVSLDILEGEVYGVLGPNGSGKTTLLKILSTILTPTSGHARVFGFDITTQGAMVRDLVALVTAEDRSFYWRLTARQNLAFFATLYGIDSVTAARKINDLLKLFELTKAADKRVGEFSTGMKQKLAIARGLLSSPRLLFLDEPTRGLDPASAHGLLSMVQSRLIDYFDNTVILTTHIMREVETLCQRVGVLRYGKLVYSGGLTELKQSLRPHDRYLLRLAPLSDATCAALAALDCVERCERAQDSGEQDLDLSLLRDGNALDRVLKVVREQHAVVVDCVKLEQSLEETFRSLFAEEGHDGAITSPVA